MPTIPKLAPTLAQTGARGLNAKGRVRLPIRKDNGPWSAFSPIVGAAGRGEGPYKPSLVGSTPIASTHLVGPSLR